MHLQTFQIRQSRQATRKRMSSSWILWHIFERKILECRQTPQCVRWIENNVIAGIIKLCQLSQKTNLTLLKNEREREKRVVTKSTAKKERKRKETKKLTGKVPLSFRVPICNIANFVNLKSVVGTEEKTKITREKNEIDR